MNLSLDATSVAGYHSATQIARVITETWVAENMFCPHCGNPWLQHFPNNQPVADFFCPTCRNQYELKSKAGKLGKKVNDGAYNTMIQRITGNDNPDFFMMSYSPKTRTVVDFIMIPKYFFVPALIEHRKPLAETARRAGWIGCNILLDQIPEQGRIKIVENGVSHSVNTVVQKVNQAEKFKIDSIEARGWLFDTLSCVNAIQTREFTLSEIYQFEGLLAQKHPTNKNIRPKIRQQLQVLRDKGFLQFLGNGVYEKV